MKEEARKRLKWALELRILNSNFSFVRLMTQPAVLHEPLELKYF